MQNKTIFFLCTGNYYRSRFAEMLFNHEAKNAGLDWRATSRGLAVELGKGNIGPMSVNAIKELRNRGVEIPEALRDPLQVTVDDFISAGRIIALLEEEHRPMIEQQFKEFSARVEYWNVPDVGGMEVKKAVQLIEDKIKNLVGAVRP